MSAYENSYWNSKGKHQDLYNKVVKFVPTMGECPKDKPKLERLRRAANCYYDLFNNGLGNRAGEFRRMFGFSPRKAYPCPRYGYRDIDFENEEMNTSLNETLDRLIVAAAIETGVLDLSTYNELTRELDALVQVASRLSGLVTKTERESRLARLALRIKSVRRELEDQVETYDEE